MKKIIILDCNQGGVHVFPIDESKYKDDDGEFCIIDFLDDMNEQHDLHLRDSEVSWMLSQEETFNITHY